MNVSYISNFDRKQLACVESAIEKMPKEDRYKFEICYWPIPFDNDPDYDYPSALRQGLWCILSRANKETNERFFRAWCDEQR